LEGRFDRRSASFAMVPFFFCIAVRRVVHFCAYLFSYSPLPLSSAPSPVVYVRAFCVCLYTSRPGLVCFFLLQHTLSFARRCRNLIETQCNDSMGWSFMVRMDSEMQRRHNTTYTTRIDRSTLTDQPINCETSAGGRIVCVNVRSLCAAVRTVSKVERGDSQSPTSARTASHSGYIFSRPRH